MSLINVLKGYPDTEPLAITLLIAAVVAGYAGADSSSPAPHIFLKIPTRVAPAGLRSWQRKQRATPRVASASLLLLCGPISQTT